MTTAGNRRSKEIGHDMSKELGNLKHDIKSFKELFDGKKTDLQERANYFKQKAADIKSMQDKAAIYRNVVFGITALGLGLTFVTGGTSLLVTGTLSGAAIAASNTIKNILENNGKEKIKNNAEEFNKNIQPIVECLEKIQTNVQTLEELFSSTSMVAAGLSTAAKVTRLLKNVAELCKSIELGAVRLEVVLLDIVRLLDMIMAIFEVRRDEALENKFFAKIMESAELCRKTIIDFETLTGEFNKVSDFLQHF